VSTEAWISDLKEAIRAYTEARHLTPVVKVTLANGESRYVMRATSGEAGMLVVLDVYPERAGDLLEVERVEEGQLERVRETREVLVVHPAAIVKVELLHEHPGEPGAFGFQTPPQE
jgi:hypothetical protein